MATRNRTFIRLKGALLGALVLLAGCAGEMIRIDPHQEGYTVTLPQEMMKGFPDGKPIRVVIDDPKAGKTQVKGVGVKTSERGFLLRTNEELRFIPDVESTKAAGGVWIMISPATTGGMSCSGCPRASDLQKWRGDGNYCWCWAE